MEPLPHVSVGSPHSPSHNEERDRLNELSQILQDVVIDPLMPTDAQIAFEINNGTLTPAALEAFGFSNGQGLPSYVSPSVQNRFLEHLSVYNWKSANLKKLRAGLGRAMTGGQSEHLVIGDSFSAGNIQAQGAPFLFARDLAWARGAQRELARHGVVSGGTGWVRCNDAALGSPLGWTFTGAGWNHAQKAYSYTASNGNYASFTPMEGGNAYSHYWFDQGAGGGSFSFVIEIDGVAYPAITSVTGAARFRCTTIIHNAPIRAGESVIKVTAGANGHYFAAGKVWNPATGGLQISNIAQSGSRVYSTAAGQIDRWDSLGTGGLGEIYRHLALQTRSVADASVTSGSAILDSVTGAFSIDDVGKPLFTPAGTLGLTLDPTAYIQTVNSPTQVVMSKNALRTASGLTMGIGRKIDMVWIELGGNDISNGVTNANIRAAIQSVRARYPGSDVGLMTIHQPISTLVPSATFDAFIGQHYELADDLDCPLIDLRDRFGTHADMVSTDQLGDAAVHPLASVYSEVGRLVGNLLAA